MTKLLVVDDDPRIRDALEVALTLQWGGASIVTASTGDEALRVFFDTGPGHRAPGCSLPGLSGFEVLRQIRQVSDTPVLLVTARGDEADQVRGLELGADDYVVKPFSLPGSWHGSGRSSAAPSHRRSPRGVPDFTAGSLTIALTVARCRPRPGDPPDACRIQAALPSGPKRRASPDARRAF